MEKNSQTCFIMQDYQKKTLFFSFLPGISGEHGIPLWCHYLNRGQGVASFGVLDKNHSIMEFYPAHQAAERTPLLGFRTFLKVNGNFMEAFASYERCNTMKIDMNRLVIEDSIKEAGIQVTVEYEGLPEEPLAGLLRKVSITNTGTTRLTIEAADGMAEVLPYGVTAVSMKEMGQTSKAWMQAKGMEDRLPVFQARASMEDSAEVRAVEGVHFGLARMENGELLPVITDRELIFESDSALLVPQGWKKHCQKELLQLHQNTCNDTPCCIFLAEKELAPGESLIIQEVYGMAEQKELFLQLAERSREDGWFEKKRSMACELTEKLTDRIAVKTGDSRFDGYCRQTFLDNLLRGGYPEKIGDTVFYLYSRKHGDMERDYNFFSMLPEYYSQGNGNFRDVNQNRRCDVQFAPFTGTENIKSFFDAIQINGYNPLGVEKVTFSLPENPECLSENADQLSILTGREFTPGELYRCIEKAGLGKEETQKHFERILSACTKNDTKKFIEGYWCDHWTYNLDLLESYLKVFPENKAQVLFDDHSYRFFQAEAQILPRKKRYVETAKGLRQYQFLRKTADTSRPENRYLKTEAGEIVTASLMEKQFALCTVKMTALDPYGMGIEMEGGKPGWYDALNGLPGLFGSSMAETFELMRLLEFVRKSVSETMGSPEEAEKTLQLPEEVAELSDAVLKAADQFWGELKTEACVMEFWNQVNDAKEAFWEKTEKSISGKKCDIHLRELEKIISVYQKILQCGIEKSERYNPDVPATYYYYRVDSYRVEEDGIIPESFAVCNTPDFLEGAVHMLKLPAERKEKEQIYSRVRESRLFDEKLNVYKVNASLSEASFELGRACAFTPGWLENESVWLHMEYKYLLELLKSGLYEEFISDFHNCAVPFLDETVYGRSTLENSSFIASSKNPNEKIHGKGFVARLSGSTAEFLQMWQIMMFGQEPFRMENGELVLVFDPLLPSYLIGEDKTVEAMFLGETRVCYLLSEKKNVIPGSGAEPEYCIEWKDGKTETMSRIAGAAAEAVRSGSAAQITVKR